MKKPENDLLMNLAFLGLVVGIGMFVLPLVLLLDSDQKKTDAVVYYLASFFGLICLLASIACGVVRRKSIK